MDGRITPEPKAWADPDHIGSVYTEPRRPGPVSRVDVAGYEPFCLVTRHADGQAVERDAAGFTNHPRSVPRSPHRDARLHRQRPGPLPDRSPRMTAPLAGFVVLDFTHAVAGPLAAMILADYGARVIKIEPPAGDGARRLSRPEVPDYLGQFETYNRGNESAVLDLSTEPDGTRRSAWSNGPTC